MGIVYQYIVTTILQGTLIRVFQINGIALVIFLCLLQQTVIVTYVFQTIQYTCVIGTLQIGNRSVIWCNSFIIP